METTVNDSWQTGDPYEYYMGRWSKRVAELFVDWLSQPSGLRWLDVGCGSGALSEVVLAKNNPVEVIAIDPSEGFVRTAQQRLGNRARCQTGDALSLPLDDASVHASVSGLVLNFLSDPGKALGEMRRVTQKGGAVAVYVWDYTGRMELLKYFWDMAVELNPKAARLHESRRFPEANAEDLIAAFKRSGFSQVETTAVDIMTNFSSFGDYWKPFLGGQGPAPTYVMTLDRVERNKLEEALARRLPINTDGSISLAARAWAARGFA